MGMRLSDAGGFGRLDRAGKLHLDLAVLDGDCDLALAVQVECRLDNPAVDHSSGGVRELLGRVAGENLRQLFRFLWLPSAPPVEAGAHGFAGHPAGGRDGLQGGCSFRPSACAPVVL